MKTCHWCGKSDDQAVCVGVVHAASGPGSVLHACLHCLSLHGFVPLDEHPPDSLGEVRSTKPTRS
ncbi:hypothetical protein [Streptomyces sp. NPDC046887]|uniref:hypothetical protein n=1 Tax=Streptomyces sp. NPDC046887 TaxID=3155472 RepID=UPI0033EDF61E